MLKPLTVMFCLICGGALAETCAPATDRSDERDALLGVLRDAPDAQIGRAAVQAVWEFWTEAPDDAAQDMLDRGMRKMREADYETAEAIFEELVDYCPDYAEGWNQRAFARFLRNRFEGSLEDISRTLELEPAHFGALAGRAMILIRQGRIQLAQTALRRAVAVNPWLNERRFLVENPGKEL